MGKQTYPVMGELIQDSKLKMVTNIVYCMLKTHNIKQVGVEKPELLQGSPIH